MNKNALLITLVIASVGMQAQAACYIQVITQIISSKHSLSAVQVEDGSATSASKSPVFRDFSEMLSNSREESLLDVILNSYPTVKDCLQTKFDKNDPDLLVIYSPDAKSRCFASKEQYIQQGLSACSPAPFRE